MNSKEMTVWIVALVLAAGVLISPAACTMNRQRLVFEAINNGADPTVVKCAMENDIENTPQCVLVAARPSEKSKP